MRVFPRFIAVTFGLLYLAAPVAAVPLPPLGVVPLAGTTAAARPELAGVVQADPLRPFEITDAGGNVVFSGNIQDRVVRSDVTGTLTFEPRLRELDDHQSGYVIVALVTSGFAGFTTDVDFRLDGLGNIGPSSASRLFDEVAYDFDSSPLTGADTSYFITNLTDATAFAEEVARLTVFVRSATGGELLSATVAGFVPVPEPASVILLAMGMALLPAAGKRLRR